MMEVSVGDMVGENCFWCGLLPSPAIGSVSGLSGTRRWGEEFSEEDAKGGKEEEEEEEGEEGVL